MGSMAAAEKPHAVCIPYPCQGHINPMLTLAKLLHLKGFHITFVHTEYNHGRLLRSRGPSALDGLPDFQFRTIPDGLPPSSNADDVTQDIPSLCQSTMTTCLGPFRELLTKINSDGGPAVTCIVSDAIMSFTLDAAGDLGVPAVLLWAASACGYMVCLHYKELIGRGLVPLRGIEDLRNGYLDTPVDWIPGMKNIRLGDLSTTLRTTDPNDIMLNFVVHQAQQAATRATAIVFNTFHDLEAPVLDAMAALLPPCYTIGPLPLLARHIPGSRCATTSSMGSSLWSEDERCMQWLDGREPSSVVYINFGSITVMSSERLVEFAWGLARSNHDFLWVIRPDLVRGEKALLPPEFFVETEGRGLLLSWCPQEAVLGHPAVGCFLTHCGWNSTLESICGGVPMLCWPFFADQPTNCRYACGEWGVGMDVGGEVSREELASRIGEAMVGEMGMEMRKRAVEWKERAELATVVGGASFTNLEKLVEEVLLAKQTKIKGFHERT